MGELPHLHSIAVGNQPLAGVRKHAAVGENVPGEPVGLHLGDGVDRWSHRRLAVGSKGGADEAKSLLPGPLVRFQRSSKLGLRWKAGGRNRTLGQWFFGNAQLGFVKKWNGLATIRHDISLDAAGGNIYVSA